jgi:hypothetical protein
VRIDQLDLQSQLDLQRQELLAMIERGIGRITEFVDRGMDTDEAFAHGS